MLLAMVVHSLDAALVRRFKNGDETAFTELVERYKDRVYGLCLRWMRDPIIAEEVAQDVFVALYRSLHRFRGDSQLSTWIYRVAVNHCKNRKLYRQRRATDRHEPLEGTRTDGELPARQLPSQDPGTDAETHRNEAAKIVHDALGQIDEEARQIIIMRDIQDCSYEEISDILEIPRGTVKSRLHRARSQLARVLSTTLDRDDLI